MGAAPAFGKTVLATNKEALILDQAMGQMDQGQTLQLPGQATVLKTFPAAGNLLFFGLQAQSQNGVKDNSICVVQDGK